MTSSLSRESSLQQQEQQAGIAHANNGNAVQDVLFFVRDSHFSKMKEKGHFSIWLEQLSWMLLLQSHRRVPDCDTLSAQQSRSSSPLSSKKKSVSNVDKANPLIRYSIVTSPDDCAVETARSLHSELTQHFFNDDAHRNLVDIEQTITCHRSLSGFYADPKMRKITIADISAPSSTATSRAHSPSFLNINNNNAGSADDGGFSNLIKMSGGGLFGAKVKTMGVNPGLKPETLDGARDRLLDFFMNLVGTMDPTEIQRSPQLRAANLVMLKKQQQQHRQAQPKVKKPRDSDSDSSSEEEDDASFRLDDDDDDDDDENNTGHQPSPFKNNNTQNKKNVDGNEDDDDNKLEKAALSCRQVIFVICNDFCFESFCERCGIVVSTAQSAWIHDCFMWARSRGQLKWYCPMLWNEASLNASLNATPRLLPAEATPPPSSSSLLSLVPLNRQQTNPLEHIVNNPNALVDQSIAFVEEPNPCNPSPSRTQQQLNAAASALMTTQHDQNNNHNNSTDDGEGEQLRSPSKQFRQVTATTTVKSPSAEKEFRLEDDEETDAVNININAIRNNHSKIHSVPHQREKLGSIEKDFVEDQQEEEQNQQEEKTSNNGTLPAKNNNNVVVIIPPLAARENKEKESEVATAITISAHKSSTATTSSTIATTKAPRYALATKTSSLHDRNLSTAVRKNATPTTASSSTSRTSSASKCNNNTVANKRTVSPIVTSTTSATYAAPLRRSSPSICTASNQQQQQQQQQITKSSANSSSRSGSTTANNSRRPSPVPRIQQQPSIQSHSTVGNYKQRSGEKACQQLYSLGTYNIRQRKETEAAEQEKKRQQEEEELRRLRQPHPHLSMYNQDPAEAKKNKSKIIHALRADPNSEEALLLVPYLPDTIPADRVRNVVKRLAPEAKGLSKREEEKLRLEEMRRQKATPTRRGASSSGNSSRCSTPPAWRGSGVAQIPPTTVVNSSTPNNNDRKDSSHRRRSSPVARVGSFKMNDDENNNSKNSVNRSRSNSPSVVNRLYENRLTVKENLQRQQQMIDLREVEDIIENRKKSNPTWLNDVRKNPLIEDQYRKRLLRTRQEERRLGQQREHHVNRNPDPRFPPSATLAHHNAQNSTNTPII